VKHALTESLKVSMIFSDPVKDWLPPSCLSPATVEKHLPRLLRFVKERNYEGADPEDGAESLLLKLTLEKSRKARLTVSRFCKHTALNWRSILAVPKHFNPLGGALFLLGYLNLLEKEPDEMYGNEAYILFQRLRHERLPRGSGSAWGQPFARQTHAFYAPARTPDLLATVWVGHAMLAYHQRSQDTEALSMALGVSDFLLNEMIRPLEPGVSCFRYLPGEDLEMHSVNLAGAAYLAKILPYLPDEARETIKERLLETVRFSLMDIGSDGNWPAGSGYYHRVAEHAHTAACIDHLLTLYLSLEQEDLVPLLRQVVGYYLFNLFSEEGFPKATVEQAEPISTHDVAQSIALVHRLRKHRLWIHSGRLTQVESGLLAQVQRFQDPKGYFYHQQKNGRWNKIPYMGWGQAAMFYALSSCMEETPLDLDE
jgi:hypothetical protein